MRYLTLILALVLASCGPRRGSLTPARPNIVVVFADDLGYGDVGCYGAPDIRTPVMDRLAEEGVRFTHFYSNGPECTPTRTAFMTGRYQRRAGGLECAIGTSNVGRYDDAIRLRKTNDLGLPAEQTSIGRILRDAGYATAVYGKWHLGYERKFFPDRHGFEDSFFSAGGGIDYFHHTEWDGKPVLYRNGEPLRRDGYMTDLITGDAVAFLRRQKGDRPFFLYVPYTAPHNPYQGPRDRREQPILKPDWNKGTRETYARMVERMDEGIGAILDALKRGGFEERTLFIFASDNGANQKGRNLPFSGFKGGLFEGGIRVPAIVRWPGKLVPKTISDRVMLSMDLTAAIARAAGVRPPADRPYDGVDVIGDLVAARPARKRPVFWRQRRGDLTWRAVRDGDLKYLSKGEGEAFDEYLFDLALDPAEQKNLSAERKQDLKRLQGLMAKWEDEVKPER